MNFTCDTSTSKLVVMVHVLSNNSDPSGVTYGGINLNNDYDVTYNGGSGSERIAFFSLDNPPTGTSESIVVSGSNDWYLIGRFA
jgi:hypothetical protein